MPELPPRRALEGYRIKLRDVRARHVRLFLGTRLMDLAAWILGADDAELIRTDQELPVGLRLD